MDKIQTANAVIASIVKFLDTKKLEYTYEPEEHKVRVTIYGEDFPVTLSITANVEQERLDLFSHIPFKVKSEGRDVQVAMAIAAVNDTLVFGRFVLYPDQHACTYESTQYFSQLEGFDVDYAESVVMPAYVTVEEYNDKLYAINEGIPDVQKFIDEM